MKIHKEVIVSFSNRSHKYRFGRKYFIMMYKMFYSCYDAKNLLVTYKMFGKGLMRQEYGE